MPHEKESNIKMIVYNNSNSVAKSIVNIASQATNHLIRVKKIIVFVYNFLRASWHPQHEIVYGDWRGPKCQILMIPPVYVRVILIKPTKYKII